MTLFSSVNLSVPLARTQSSCAKCGRSSGCSSPKMAPHGDGKKGIFILAEAPGEKEDKLNKPMVGSSGALLRSILGDLDVDVDIDCRKMNALSCYSEKEPTDAQIEACNPRVTKEIKDSDPKVVILLGMTAVRSILGSLSVEDDSSGGMGLWRGWRIPDQRLKRWICPTFHPSFLRRSERNDDAAETIFRQDLQAAVEMTAAKFPEVDDVDPYLEYDLEDSEVIARIKKAMMEKETAFDYETTGLKPHRKGHDIAYASICDRWNHSFSFAVTKKVRPYLVEYLASDVPKIGANIQFEELWSQEILKTPVMNWTWDVLVAAHILDNRSGASNLKFQTYVNFGIPDYSHEIESYLKGEDKSGNDFNRIYSAPARKMKKYNAMDSLMTLWLKKKQIGEMLWPE